MTKRRIARIAFMVGLRCRSDMTIAAGAACGCLTVVLSIVVVGWMTSKGWIG